MGWFRRPQPLSWARPVTRLFVRCPCCRSDLYNYTKLRCNPATWSYTEAVSILDGDVIFAYGSMAVGEGAGSRRPAFAPPLFANLTDTNFSCPALKPPVTCAAAPVYDMVTLRMAAESFMPLTQDVVLLSLADNVTLDDSFWRTVRVSLAVYDSTNDILP